MEFRRCEVSERLLDRREGLSVLEELRVALVEQGEGEVDITGVHSSHDACRRLVPMRRDESHERAQSLSVQRSVGPVAVWGALRGRHDALLFVVPHSLRGQPVFTSKVDRTQTLFAHLLFAVEAYSHICPLFASKFQPKV